MNSSDRPLLPMQNMKGWSIKKCSYLQSGLFLSVLKHVAINRLKSVAFCRVFLVCLCMCVCVCVLCVCVCVCVCCVCVCVCVCVCAKRSAKCS